MFRSSLLTLFALLTSLTAVAQMPTPDGVRYGHEWIDPAKEYFRIDVAEDGVYRLDAAAFGPADRLALWHDGVQVPLVVADGALFFYGERARGEMDAHLFVDPETQQLNPEYGMYTDTAAYYLTTLDAGATPLRYTQATRGGGAAITTVDRTATLVTGESPSKEYQRSSGFTIYYSRYSIAEGYGALSTRDLGRANGEVNFNYTIPLPGATGAAARLTTRFGVALDDHRQRISIDGAAVEEIASEEWDLFERAYDLTPDGEEVMLSFSGLAGDRDKANMAFARVEYPSVPRAENGVLRFSLPAGPAGTLSVAGLETSGALLLNLTDNTFHRPQPDGSFALPAGGEREFIAAGVFLSPAGVRRMQLDVNLPDGDENYLIIASRKLTGSGIDRIVAHRESTVGGSYRVHVAYIEDLYDAFGYGLKRHPQSMRNYIARAQAAAPGLRYLMLIGKGREYWSIRSGEALENAESTFFVPGFGFPASDNLLTAPLDGVVPTLATGRLPAVSAAEVDIYASKLIEVESQIARGDQTAEDRDWMKQFLHLGGGQTPGEQSSIRRHLAEMEDVIESSRLGGSVTSVYRTSTEPIEEARQEEIFRRINAGTAGITFFGHSGTQGFDLNIDNLDNYRNKGKYPYIMSLGCYSGDAFTSIRSIGEEFVFLQDGGAIAFGASKGVGFVSALRDFGEALYNHIGNEEYGNGIGDAFVATIDQFKNTSNFTVGILLEQFALSGDPAFRFHPRPGPDFIVDASSVAFEPSVVPAQDPTFEASFRITNLGSNPASLPDSLNVRFRQQLPDGTVEDLVTTRVATPPYVTEATVTLPNLGFPAVGINRILITVDADDAVQELPLGPAETNNEVKSGGRDGIPLTIVANTARVAYPPQYAVVPPGVELVANTTDPLAEERTYLLQIATESDFSMPLIDERLTVAGGGIRYTPSLPGGDSTTYYWRISPDSTENLSKRLIWSESSFTVVQAAPTDEIGWAQQHSGQLDRGSFVNIDAGPRAERWTFQKNINDFEVVNGKYRNGDFPRVAFNGTRINSYFPWRTRAGFNVAVIDSLDNGDTEVMAFGTQEEDGRTQLIDFLEGIPEGKYVLVYSAQRGTNDQYHNEGWDTDSARTGKSIYATLEAEGALQIRALENLGSVPYAFGFQKGLGPLAEAVATDPEAEIRILVATEENWDRGSFTSAPIGPALRWEGLRMLVKPDRLGPADSVAVRVYGSNGSSPDRQLLRSEARALTAGREFNFDLADVDADNYPYLSLEAEFFDDSLTVATIDELYADYLRTGDVSVNPRIAYTLAENVDRGESFPFEIGYENLSTTAMDSILVRLDILRPDNTTETILRRTPPLPGRGQGVLSYQIVSDDLTGTTRFQLVMNPEQDQREEVIRNNFLSTTREVSGDVIAPDLKVYFDGRRIRDGELVSAEPEILIQLRDENRFLALDDSNDYVIDLYYPDGNRERIELADERIDFIAGSPSPDEENLAEIYFRPTLLQDGIYELGITARDRTDNKAGDLEFRQSFEVINEELVSNVLAYPNPFTTQTRFVYTLTGSVTPEVFRIQIMTVSGRVVRDIDLLATETLSVGTHQTDFAWDGTDEYGDPLANGVYLYRVITSDTEGRALEKYDNGTDEFFKNGMGKVVILR